MKADMSQQIVEAREAERRSLARDLHDGLGQSLVVVQMSLRATRDRLSPDDATGELLDSSIALLDGLHAEVRGRALALHSSLLDDLGLAPALRAHTVQLARATHTRIGFESHGELAFTRWPAAIETSAFRIAQEALTNALRHAHALNIGVAVSAEEGRLSLRIHDDGVGFNARAQRGQGRRTSLGLVSMAERARLAGGRLTITSEPGRGTTVCVEFARPRSRRALTTR